MIDSLIQNLGVEIAVSLIATAILSSLGYIFSSRFRSVARRTHHYLFDTKVQANLSRVDRYDQEPFDDIDMDIFREISELSPNIEFDAIDNEQNKLRVKGEALPTPLEIRIESRPTFENGTQKTQRYEVIIETYTDMVFGYRSDAPLNEFMTLSEDIADVIQNSCFNRTRPNTTFLTGKIKGQLPTEKDRIEDDDINMRAKVSDNQIKMTFEDPRYLSRGIRKYFQPL